MAAPTAAAASVETDVVVGLDDDHKPVEMISFVCEGKDVVEVKKSAALTHSGMVKTTLEGDPTSTSIPMPSIKIATMMKVVEYLNHYDCDVKTPTIEKPIKSANMADLVPKWDAKFIDLDKELIFDIVIAANYLDIKSLLNLGCAKVATMLKGKTKEQIRDEFGIPTQQGETV